LTVEDLFRSVLGRWPVMLAGVLLTLAVCVVTWRAPGVYWASTKVYLLVPATAHQPNQLAPDNSAAIPLAGLIQTEINGGNPPREATSPDVTLVDEGIYDGWSVLLPDTGGQWAHDFPESTLIVQASGPSAEVVQSRSPGWLPRVRTPPTCPSPTGSISPCPRRWWPCNTPTDTAAAPWRSSCCWGSA
jgi:hypothetical protein